MNRAMSMRRRIIARLLAGALLVTLTSALGLYLYLRGELLEEYDGAIVAKARALAEILSEEHEHFFGQSAIDRPRSVPRLTLHRGDYYQVWSTGGAVAGRSASLEGYDLPRIGRMRRGRPVSVVYEVSLPGGRRGRAVEALVDPATATDYAAAETGQTSVLPPSLVIATDVEEMEETLLDNLKQLGFYTDCLGKKHWSLPDEVIDKELAVQIVKIAGLWVPRREATEREIELWIQYIKPVWKGPMERMEAALAAWHRQMCAENLIEDDPNSMERFVVEGLDTSTRSDGASSEDIGSDRE